MESRRHSAGRARALIGMRGIGQMSAPYQRSAWPPKNVCCAVMKGAGQWHAPISIRRSTQPKIRVSHISVQGLLEQPGYGASVAAQISIQRQPAMARVLVSRLWMRGGEEAFLNTCLWCGVLGHDRKKCMKRAPVLAEEDKVAIATLDDRVSAIQKAWYGRRHPHTMPPPPQGSAKA